MAFTIPEGLHEDLYPLAWLIGTWRGTGHGEYPGIEPFSFAQEVSFNHDGRPFLNYFPGLGLLMRIKKLFVQQHPKLVIGDQNQMAF